MSQNTLAHLMEYFAAHDFEFHDNPLPFMGSYLGGLSMGKTFASEIGGGGGGRVSYIEGGLYLEFLWYFDFALDQCQI